MQNWDVIVVGSGAGAMTSALRASAQGLSVLVVEKAEVYGGTSALSGGGIWIPMNPGIEGVGGEDNFSDAWTYITTATKGAVPEARLRKYLEAGPEMVKWLARQTRLKFNPVFKYPDYYPNLPGSRPGYRTMEPFIIKAQELGDDFDKMRPSLVNTLLLGRINLTTVEGGIFLSRSSGWVKVMIKLLLQYWLDLPSRLRGKRRDRRLTLGQALVAALRVSMKDKNIPLWLNTAFTGLVVENGRVTGIDVQRNGKSERLHARHGVILAAGGFEQNQKMRERYFPKPTQTNWSSGVTSNTGDTIEAGIAIGAATEFMDHAWWAPTVEIPGRDLAWASFADRASPGSIIVNSEGKRFHNEAAPYLEFGASLYTDDAAGHGTIPAWMVFDVNYRKKYVAGPLLPAQLLPDKKLPEEWKGAVYHKADTLDALAAKINVDAVGLQETVTRMNGYAKTGKDLEFHKGDNIYDRYYGDPAHKPNPCLGELTTGPFYAVKLVPGDIGTKGGLKADEYARVISTDGEPIPGLYAIGNNSAALMGPSYPGPGSTLGPAMVMGYVAADHIAENAKG